MKAADLHNRSALRLLSSAGNAWLRFDRAAASSGWQREARQRRVGHCPANAEPRLCASQCSGLVKWQPRSICHSLTVGSSHTGEPTDREALSVAGGYLLGNTTGGRPHKWAKSL
jgi:hypothetical protein